MFSQWYTQPPAGLEEEDDLVALQTGMNIYRSLSPDDDLIAERQLYHAWVQLQARKSLRASHAKAVIEVQPGNVIPLKTA